VKKNVPIFAQLVNHVISEIERGRVAIPSEWFSPFVRRELRIAHRGSHIARYEIVARPRRRAMCFEKRD